MSSLRVGLTVAAVAGGVLALTGTAMAIVTPTVRAAGPAVEPATEPQIAAGADAATATAQPTLLRTTGLRVTALPAPLEVASLVKAAGLAEAAERAERRTAPNTGPGDTPSCHADLNGLGPVKPWARSAARFVSCLYDEPALDGVSAESGRTKGLAVDIKVHGSRGDRVAACVLANRKELGVDSVLWKQRANDGDGWERLPDRGGDSANHRDHVRISFHRAVPKGSPDADRCR